MGKIINNIAIFLFVLVASMFVFSFFLSLWFVVGLAIIVVVCFAVGYGFAAIFGLVLGAVVWLFGVLSNLLNSVSGPISSFLHGIGLYLPLLIHGVGF